MADLNNKLNSWWDTLIHPALNTSVDQANRNYTPETSTTKGLLYLIAVDTMEKLEIQFVPPELAIERQIDIAKVRVVGRNNPLHQYVGGDTTLGLQLDFHAMDEDRKDVIRKCRWLESLGYNDGYEKQPPRVKLVFGDLFQDQIWIVQSVSYKLSAFDKQYGFLPRQAYVDIELALDPEINLKWADVQKV